MTVQDHKTAPEKGLKEVHKGRVEPYVTGIADRWEWFCGGMARILLLYFCPQSVRMGHKAERERSLLEGRWNGEEAVGV